MLFSQQGLYYKPTTLLGKDLAIILAAVGASSIINQPDDQGLTPLFYAFRHYGSWDEGHFVDVLLSHGADPSVTDDSSITVLHHFVQKAGTNPNRNWTISEACLKLLDLNIPIDSRNTNGETILFTALQYNYLSPVSIVFFLRHGASLYDRNNAGQSLLHLVGGKRSRTDYIPDPEDREADVDTWRYLIEKGFDPADEDGQQRSAWDVAVAAGNTRVLGLMEGKGREIFW